MDYRREWFFALRYYNSGQLAKTCCLTCGIKYLGAQGVHFPHPIGIVIGEGVRIGKGCCIYQNVTIGGKPDPDSQACFYPQIGDRVTIFAGAILIGRLTVGDGAVIGAGSVVTHDVPSGAVVVGNPAHVLDGKASIKAD